MRKKKITCVVLSLATVLSMLCFFFGPMTVKAETAKPESVYANILRSATDFTITPNSTVSAETSCLTWGACYDYANGGATVDGCNYIKSNGWKTFDNGRKGLKLVGKQTGEAMEGKGFTLGKMSGKFDMAFRVWSNYPVYNYITYTSDAIPGNVGQINAMLDVREVSFKFTDVNTGKYFVLYVNGDYKYANYSLEGRVYIPGMPVDDDGVAGYGYVEGGTTVSSWYNTQITGTTFSNFDYGWEGSAPSIPTEVKFDPTTMTVSMAKSATDDVVVLNLKDSETLGDLVMSGFENYTVDVTIEDMTADDFTNAWSTGARARDAKMCIYSVNGVDLATDTTAPVVSFNTEATQGMEYSLNAVILDDVDEDRYFDGVLTVKDPDGNPVAVTDYKFTPEKAGDYELTFSEIKDAAGNALATLVYTLTVKGASLEFDGTVPSSAVLNSTVTLPVARFADEEQPVKVLFGTTGNRDRRKLVRRGKDRRIHRDLRRGRRV